MFRVEYLNGAAWVRHSWHINQDIAVINAEVIHKSRRCAARVISHGKIVAEFA